MFSGLVAGTGRVERLRPVPGGLELEIHSEVLFAQKRDRPVPGDSIAVNGICLTVSDARGENILFELGAETLAVTTARRWSEGDEVNLESSLRVGDALGGHYLTGHADGVGIIKKMTEDGMNRLLEIEYPSEIGGLLAVKGSVAVDGISLTVNRVTASEFSVGLIPMTLKRTIAKHYHQGARVNLEADLLARYVASSVASSLGGMQGEKGQGTGQSGKACQTHIQNDIQ